MLSPTFLFALLFVLRAFRRFGQQPAESQRMTITKKHGKRLRRIRTDDESFRVDMLCKSLADLLRACLELLRDRQAGSRAGIGQRRMKQMDRDPIAFVFDGKTFCQRFDRAFGRRVRRNVLKPGHADARACKDQPSALRLPHERQNRLGKPQRAVKVHIHHFPIGLYIRIRFAFECAQAGVMDRDVDGSKNAIRYNTGRSAEDI